MSLVLPNFLLRLPYGPETRPVEGMNYVEDVNGTDHLPLGQRRLVLAQRITEAFAKYGWCAAIRGAEGGGAVEACRHTRSAPARRPVAEVPDRGGDHRPPREGTQRSRLHFPVPQEEQRRGGVLRRPDHQQGQAQHQRGQRQRAPVGDAAVRAGGIALRPLPEGDHARQGRQLHDPRQRADLPEQLDRRLRADQRQRTAGNQGAVPARGAGGCQRGGRQTGAYRATVFLRPHFQLEELSASIRLVANLPPP